VAHLFEQAAHDSAHGGEIVDDEEFQGVLTVEGPVNGRYVARADSTR
jgi:hypothetical protein